jgi:hypothetical protein
MRYVGGPRLDTPATPDRADLLKARLAQLRPEPKHDDISNPYDFDDSERYDY